jgi:hypothetical protein
MVTALTSAYVSTAGLPQASCLPRRFVVTRHAYSRTLKIKAQTRIFSNAAVTSVDLAAPEGCSRLLYQLAPARISNEMKAHRVNTTQFKRHVDGQRFSRGGSGRRASLRHNTHSRHQTNKGRKKTDRQYPRASNFMVKKLARLLLF